MTQEKFESDEEAEQHLRPEAVEEADATQIGAGPAKRKREADENDVAEETEKSEVVEKDYSADDGGTEASFPKTLPRPPPPERKKRKKPSGEQGDAPVPPATTVKKAGPKKNKEKEEDSEKSPDPATENSDASNSEGSSGQPDGNGGESEEELEEESGKSPKPKGSKKKSATTTPKKPAAPKTTRVKQPKKPSKPSALVLTPQSGVHTTSSAAVAGKKGGEGSVQKSSTLTKAEMEILFDLVCKEMVWANAATTLNARPGGSGSNHIASNLKRHWTTTLRKRVVDGYVD